MPARKSNVFQPLTLLAFAIRFLATVCHMCVSHNFSILELIDLSIPT